jgi:putative aldouronate transport system substrate-binding protein
MKVKSTKLFVMTIVIGLLLFYSCGGKSASGTSNGNEPIQIEIYQSDGIQQPTGEAAIIPNHLDKALNIKITMVDSAQGNDYLNQLNVRLAANDPPDMFTVNNRDMLIDLVNKGMVLKLTPYLGQLKEYVDLAKTSIAKGQIGTDIYAITNYMNVAPSNTMYIRQDWLDRLNLKPPATIEEFKSVAIAFTRNDPDGNGHNDTYGLGGYGIMTSGASTGGGFNDIFGAFGIPSPGNTFIKDGKVVNALEDSAMPQALAYLADLYKAGVIDPQAFANSYIQCQQGGIQGKYGMMQMAFFDIRKPNYVEEMQAVDPKVNWQELRAIRGPGGAYNTPQDITGGGTIRVIPALLEKDPVKLNKLLELINYVSGGEGLKLVQYGLEGKHHSRDAAGNVVAITDTLLSEGSYLWSWQFGGRPEDSYLPIRWSTMLYDIEFNRDAPRIIVYDSILSPPAGFIAADANTYIDESLVSFITGGTPVSDYPKFLNTLKTQFKYQLFIDNAAQQLKDMGYVK